MKPILSAIIVLLVCLSLVLPAQPIVDRKAMADKVKAEFAFAWDGYKKYATGHDELLPVSHAARDWYDGQTVYMTPVDSLDTMILMGFKDEADKTRASIVAGLNFDKEIEVKNFEITIRL